ISIRGLVLLEIPDFLRAGRQSNQVERHASQQGSPISRRGGTKAVRLKARQNKPIDGVERPIGLQDVRWLRLSQLSKRRPRRQRRRIRLESRARAGEHYGCAQRRDRDVSAKIEG